MTIRERAQTYLELASKAKGIDWNLDEPLPDDYWFVKLLEQSPTEGVWAAQKLLEALDVLEFLLTSGVREAIRTVYKSPSLVSERDWPDVLEAWEKFDKARRFFEGSEQ